MAHVSSWAEDAVERDAWCERAQRMVGLRVQGVRYYDIDYRRETGAPGLVGPRSIIAAAEWPSRPSSFRADTPWPSDSSWRATTVSSGQ